MPAKHVIPADDAGQRLDRYLRKLLPRATLAHVFKLIRTGTVRVNGARAQVHARLQEGDEVILDLPAARLDGLMARQPIGSGRGHPRDSLHLLLKDDDILAINKPAGLAVHGGSGVGSDHLIARVHARFSEGAARTFRPAPAHRLDRETSGVLLIGRSARGLRGLTELLRRGAVRKRYWAVVEGEPEPRQGTMEAPLERADARRGPKARRTGTGRRARSEYRVLASSRGRSLVQVDLGTGRTHQIRAHLAALGCPLLGDRRYGARGRLPGGRPGFCLHAAELVFDHPVTGRPQHIKAPPPESFLAVLRALALRSPA